MTTRVVFTDKEQADLTEMQGLADSAVTNLWELVNKLLFANNYRLSGGTVSQDATPDGQVLIAPGIFVTALGQPYSLSVQAKANILSGTENQAGNIWGTGQAADAVNPRIDIICVNFQEILGTPNLKTFINDTVTPAQQYTQTVNTRKSGAPIFVVVHGTPSATPAEPPVPSGYMKICSIAVAANATTIVNANITDNLNINIKSLEQLQLASQVASAFSDILHSNGVYGGVLGQMQVVQSSPQGMSVVVSTGVCLQQGVTAQVNVAGTVPIDASSFQHQSSENISFASGDTQTLQCNGTPPHQIRSGTFVSAGHVEGTDFSINYAAGTITRLPGGNISAGGSITASYDYYLPRIDTIQILMSNGTLQVKDGTPAQNPVAPAADADAMLLAWVAVGENVSQIVTANITDKRVFLPTMDELVAARLSPENGQQTSLVNRLNAHENRQITSGQSVHGIKQGSGNGLDADTVDGIHASATPAASKLTPMDGSGRYQAADGSLITNLTVAEAQNLRPTAQSPASNTIAVHSGWFAKKKRQASVTFAGGNSPAFANVVLNGNSRIDLLYIDDTGVLQILQGVEALSPSIPAYPAGVLVIAEVTITQTSGVTINQSAIRDVRPFMHSQRALATSPDIDVADGTSSQDTTTGSGIKTNHLQDACVTLAKIASDLMTFIQSQGVQPGTVEAFAGPTTSIPAGRVLCDGTSYSRTDPAMVNCFNAIGTIWGTVDAAHFNVPDLRGVFLRGANISASDSFVDPDATARVARLTGGATGTGPGTYQLDQIVSHVHTVPEAQDNFLKANGSDAVMGTNTTVNSGATGGNETRPKNATVVYMIKL